jgi:F0F1-type ATP synthase membrane subunit b/b'
MITAAYRNKNSNVYIHFGGAKQLEQTKCEGFELLLSLQRFVMDPCQKRLQEAKEEIADRIITAQQMIENSQGAIRCDFDDHCRHFKDALEGHGLHHQFQNILETYRDDIREIIKRKIDRTLERIESGYYDK